MTLLDDLHTAWNRHDPKGVAAHYAEDGVREEFLITHARAQGRDAVAAQVQLYLDAIPDATLDFRNTYSDGADVTTIEWTFSGTHTGDAEGWPAASTSSSLALPSSRRRTVRSAPSTSTPTLPSSSPVPVCSPASNRPPSRR